MTNPNPKGEIVPSFYQFNSLNPIPVQHSTHYAVAYTGSLSQFYENALTSNLLDYIVDFSINQIAQQAFIRLSGPKPMDFLNQYTFLENKEPLNNTGSLREMAIENEYRYFEGKQIRNDEYWVKERVKLFSNRSGWNIQDLLYYEDEYYEEVCKSLKQEEGKMVEKPSYNDIDTTNKGTDDMIENDNGAGDYGLKIVLCDDGFDRESALQSQEIKAIVSHNDMEEEEEDIGLKCVKKLKVATEKEEIKNLEGSTDTGLEQEGAETSYKEDWKLKSINENNDNIDIFPGVTIFINTWNFDQEGDLAGNDAVDSIWKGLKDITPIKVKGDMQTLSMYGYMSEAINASGPVNS